MFVCLLVVEVEFAQPTYTANEADGSVQLCVNLTGEFEIDVEALLFTVDDLSTVNRAQPDSDYERSSDRILIFSTGGVRTRCENIELIADLTLENEESFLVNISSDIDAVRFLSKTAEVIIRDSDSKSIHLIEFLGRV